MRRLISHLLVLAVLSGLAGCAVYKDKNGVTHVEPLAPAAVYVGPPAVYAPPAYPYYPYYPYYGPYYYPYGYYR